MKRSRSTNSTVSSGGSLLAQPLMATQAANAATVLGKKFGIIGFMIYDNS
jgi:hypothetical protein